MSLSTSQKLRRLFLQSGIGWIAGGVSVAHQAYAQATQQALKPATPALGMLPMMAIAQPSPDRIVAVGARGSILITSAQAASVSPPPSFPPPPAGTPALPPAIPWQTASSLENITLTNLRFASNTRGYIVGHSGFVLKTDDGGNTWKSINPPAPTLGAIAMPWFDVAISGLDDLIVVGAFGRAMRSRDGGSSWRSLSLPNPKGLHLYGISHQDGQWVIVGEQGLILQSLDNGESWSAISTSSLVTWFGMLHGKDGALTVFGLQGTILNRNVGSTSFAPIATPNKSTVSAATKLKDGSVLFAMQTGQIIQWRNGNPIAQMLPFVSPFPVTAMLAVSDASGESLLVAGLRGAMRFPLRG
jgi:photosystem II stability/assembly factor-like uncharacterized protein